MGIHNELCGRLAHGKPNMLLVLGYPIAGASIPCHASENHSLADTATFLRP